MRKILLPALVISFVLCSCNFGWHETIHGNGQLSAEERNISSADRIKSLGSFDVEITEGTPASVKIEADENLLPYILTINKDGWLEIRSKNNVNLSSPNKIKIFITTDRLQDIELAGSGNVIGKSKFTGADHLNTSIAGTGNISLEVNSPSVEARIAGSGDINLAGETKSAKINIAGVGNFKAEELKAENVSVKIAGSGNVRVYAETGLDIDIAGSGDVYYKGNATVKQRIAGSGTIKHIE